MIGWRDRLASTTSSGSDVPAPRFDARRPGLRCSTPCVIYRTLSCRPPSAVNTLSSAWAARMWVSQRSPGTQGGPRDFRPEPRRLHNAVRALHCDAHAWSNAGRYPGHVQTVMRATYRLRADAIAIMPHLVESRRRIPTPRNRPLLPEVMRLIAGRAVSESSPPTVRCRCCRRFPPFLLLPTSRR